MYQNLLNFDFIYGLLSLIECSIILYFDISLIKRVKANSLVYISSFILNKNRINSFVALLIAFLVLSSSYLISSFISFYSIYNEVWEMGNIIVFGAVAIFYYLLQK
ncbi:MAG: hypothetical protein QXX36_02410 [Candidatus Rehaiarchaeum fermentans]|nr:hypothetical protein [Candidatus Rehaiarchaeum fermentans]MCW1302452.1 hypothetical protein [Candidatus Rehaiarchaeum fermentans]